MRAVDIIIKKRDGGELTKAEIDFFVQGFTRGEIADYQVSAWAMAVLLKGMTPRETTDLTLSMANSGEVLDLSSVAPLVVDKHSTGGVGDKTSLAVLPMATACGLKVGKMSGRGLGFSGGTLDKMESIPGYRVDLTKKEFFEQLRTLGIVLTGQSADLAPADGKLYALRDVTGTVDSIPLIASSVMSKKIAGGANAFVLDVKTGAGAFMPNVERARELSEQMIAIGKLLGRRIVVLISDMNQPLGEAVGNALELKEAIDTLHNEGPADFTEHCITVSAHMLVLGKKAADFSEGRRKVKATLEDGRAWKCFRSLVNAQGGDVNYIDNPSLLPKAKFVEAIKAPREGYIKFEDARVVGETAIVLGAGRAKKGDPIDHAVGIIVHHKVGDQIKTGDVLFTIHANQVEHVQSASERLLKAITWSDAPVDPLPLFYSTISSD
jgi:pyrimidine-nucleoside phosphorylase